MQMSADELKPNMQGCSFEGSGFRASGFRFGRLRALVSRPEYKACLMLRRSGLSAMCLEASAAEQVFLCRGIDAV